MSDVFDKVPGEKLLYINPETKVYFLRKRDGKIDTHLSLQTTKIAKARDLRDDYRASIRNMKLRPINSEREEEPAEPTPTTAKASEKQNEKPNEEDKPALIQTVGDLISKYEAAGYLTEDLEKRKDESLEMEVRNCNKLRAYWQDVRVDDVRRSTFVKYKEWRVLHTANGHKGLKACDYDLQTLANAAKWAIAVDRLVTNPFSERPKFQKGKLVKHCRIYCPDDADELHDAAEHLMQNPRSVVLGFQLLLESYTGLRGGELHHWGTKEFGKLTQDGRYVKVWREKNQHLVNPYCELNPGLEATMAAFAAWKKVAHPQSKKFLPSPRLKGALSEDALSHALLRLTRQKKLKKKLRPHGAGRAFFVLMRRSWGISDEQIAHEIGQTSHGATIKSTYGGVPANWKTNAPKLSWLPAHRKPAWMSIVYPRRLLETVKV